MAEEGMNVLRQALAATQSTDTAQRKQGEYETEDELFWLELACPVVAQGIATARHQTVVYQ